MTFSPVVMYESYVNRIGEPPPPCTAAVECLRQDSLTEPIILQASFEFKIFHLRDSLPPMQVSPVSFAI